ncbi:MAG TPA: cell division protein ZapA, partial [Pseudorhizobium sp.]|nr:cell division protein ZapA [Pseudorhizobium sp.]
MAQVTVTIDGKAYRMACEEGQEAHLTDLAGRFDQYVSHLKSQFGEIGDLRLTVMAGIMVMD